MSTITRIEVLTAQLPFRFAFGHALAERRSSDNVYVKVTLDDGTWATARACRATTSRARPSTAPSRALRAATARAARPRAARPGRRSTRSLDESCSRRTDEPGGGVVRPGARRAGCAGHTSVVRCSTGSDAASAVVRYDAIIPFRRRAPRLAVAVLVRALGFRQVKVKVGGDLERDLQRSRCCAACSAAASTCASTPTAPGPPTRRWRRSTACGRTASALSSSRCPPTT